MMKNSQFLNFGTGGKFNAHDILWSDLMFTVSNRFREGVGGIKDQKIGITNKVQKRIIFKVCFVGVLAVSRVNHCRFVVLNSVTIGHAWMVLFKKSNPGVTNFNCIPWLMLFKRYTCPKCIKTNWEKRVLSSVVVEILQSLGVRHERPPGYLGHMQVQKMEFPEHGRNENGKERYGRLPHLLFAASVLFPIARNPDPPSRIK